MLKCLYLICRRACLLLCLLTGAFGPVRAQIINTFAGNGFAGYSGDGAAAISAMLDSPTCVSTDAAGNIYISDQKNSCVRKVNTSGVITTIAGTGIGGYNGDTFPATASKLNLNWGIAADGGGNVYVTDQANYRVRKVSPAGGGTISTIAGSGIRGNTGDGGPATLAKFKRPIGIATDGAGNVYIADPDAFIIRKVNAAGTISKFAGNGTYGFSGDNGPALSAKLSLVWGLAADAAGNVYICDGDNNRVRMVDPSGKITTIAGNGAPGYSDGIPATDASLHQPTGVYVSNSGEVYIADCQNNRIRKVNTTGIISTIAGTGAMDFYGDGGPALGAAFNHPVSVTMDADGSIYVADLDNVRIRKISKALFFIAGHTQAMEICENVPSAPLNTQLAAIDYYTGFTATWSLVSGPMHGSAVISYSTPTSGGGTLTPTGLSYSPYVGYSGMDTLVVAVYDGSATDTTTISIKIDPIFLSAGTITGASSVCAGSSVTLTDSATGGVWTCSNANATVSPIAFGCIVTGITPGTDTVIYTVSNPCGIAVAKKPITINLAPDAGTITGPTGVCKGSAITLNDTAADGVWSSSNDKATVSPAFPGCTVMGVYPGLDTIIYTVSNTLCKALAAYPIIVDTFPYAGYITGPANVCIGSQITLSDPVARGTWSTADSTATLLAENQDCIVTGVSRGDNTVRYGVTNSCGTAFATLLISVGSLPDIPAVTAFEGVFYAPAGYSSYQWSLNGSAIPGATTDSFVVADPGLYAVTVTNTSGCSTNSVPEEYTGCNPNDLKLYPNPTTATVYVQWCKRVTIRVICADGKWAKTVRNTDVVDISDLPNGVYFLSFFDGNGIRVKTKRVTKITN